MIEIALGLGLGIGLWVLVDSRRPQSLAARIAPHVRDVGIVAGTVRTNAGIADAIVALLPSLPGRLRSLWRARRTARLRLIESEMPAILDRLALCLSAGIGMDDAFARVGEGSVGILGREASTIATDLSVGVALVDACSASEKRVRHESWGRLMEHVLGSRRHGTPLADIVRSLAEEERASAGRRLIEAASAREVLMLLPLVFAILPMTVVIAVFPGLVALGSFPT